MRITVFGAGAWGTALAAVAAPRHEVTLCARRAGQAEALAAQKQNDRYLPGFSLPARLSITDDSDAAGLAESSDLVIVATPIAGLREMLARIEGHAARVAWACKGFEPGSGPSDGLLGHEIKAQVAPHVAGGVLSGPSFALEVARGQPTALVAASESPEVRELLVAAFHAGNLRVYANDDVIGVEVGGAVKNVLAIATGLCDGLGLGLNARAALITRGLAEMTRLGVALGARAETFMGLSGLGDLVLTATGDLSRNRRVGLALAQGQSLQEAVHALGHVAEGVYCARTVVGRATRLGVDMPISSAVVALLDGRLTARAAVAELMSREARLEG